MSRAAASPIPLRARPASATFRKVVWRIGIIGLALHAAVVIAALDIGAVPDTGRVLLLMGAALTVAAVWSRAKPIVVPTMPCWERAALEAAAVGPSAALFAALLGWSVAYPH